WRRQKVREVTASGQTVEEAVQSALKQLSMSREEVEIDVIDQGKKGFLGLFGATRSIVKVREKSEASLETEENIEKQYVKEEEEEHKDDNEEETTVNQETAPKMATEENITDAMEEAENYLKTIANHMGVEIEVETTADENRAYFDLSGEKIAILIGKRGKTLNAIQYLTQLCINRDGRKFHSVIVDAEGYRKRREDTLKELAKKMASKAIRIDEKVALEPMPAFERKIIHSSLQKSD